MNSLRAGPLPDEDLTCAIVLTRLVRSELEPLSTGVGERLSDSEIELAQKTLKSVLKRLGIVLDLEWQNFTSFKT